MEALILLDRNSMLVRVKLKNKQDGAAVVSASPATIRLLDVHGREVEGETWPKTLSSKGEIDTWGVWEATLPPDLSTALGGTVRIGHQLTLEVNVVETSSSLRFFSRPRVTVKERVD